MNRSFRVLIPVLLCGATACKSKPTQEAPVALASATAAPPAASAPLAPPPAPPRPEDELEVMLRRWNEATNLGDGNALAELYAERLALYGQNVARARAVELKVQAKTKDPRFVQSIDHVRWEKRRDGGEATFDKKSRTDKGERTARGYITLRTIDGSVRIVGEGDRETDRGLTAKREAAIDSWVERSFNCPACAAEDDTAAAYPPLGPRRLTLTSKAPPDAPTTVEFARLYLDRFASAVDIPTFAVVTPHSGNGDGRWFYVPSSREGDAGASAPQLLECAAGGFWTDPGEKQRGTPDRGHPSHPEITSVETVTRDAEGVHYDKHLYSPERVENFLTCTFDRRYEAYFLAILRHSGRSLRAISGGQPHRPIRESDPF